jgi:hypothetical protein
LEHVVPRWLGDVLHGEGEMTHSYADPGAAEPSRSWTSISPDFKARVVCAECNNGWMSSLEGAAGKRLKGPIGGVPRSFSRVDARVLGRWGAKTALMFQAMEPEDKRVVEPVFYRELRTAEPLPPTLRVWAAKVNALGVFGHAFRGSLHDRGIEASMFTLLATFDRLAFMVTGSPNVSLLQTLELGNLSNAWVELGEVGRAVRWPKPFVFGTDDFMAMPTLMAKLARIP